MSRSAKTYGYARRASVPAIEGTTTKRCPTCKTWFATYPRQRVCYGCSTPARRRELDQITTPSRTATVGRKPKLKTGDSTARALTLLAARYDSTQETPPKDFAAIAHTGISFACSHPREGQAEILGCDQGRRHPYGGKRPQWSGFCVGPCACKCHTPEPTEPVQRLMDVVL